MTHVIHGNLPFIPFGKLLNQYLEYNIEMTFAIDVFAGKGSILEASKMIARGQLALAIPQHKHVRDYQWPKLKGLRLILDVSSGVDAFEVRVMAYELLARGAFQVCIFYGDSTPVEIYSS